jgi:hypothetical protein
MLCYFFGGVNLHVRLSMLAVRVSPTELKIVLFLTELFMCTCVGVS